MRRNTVRVRNVLHEHGVWPTIHTLTGSVLQLDLGDDATVADLPLDPVGLMIVDTDGTLRVPPSAFDTSDEAEGS